MLDRLYHCIIKTVYVETSLSIIIQPVKSYLLIYVTENKYTVKPEFMIIFFSISLSVTTTFFISQLLIFCTNDPVIEDHL